jgi:HSP20 family molecular chaperone IbpA
VDTDMSVWVIAAIPGVTAERLQVRLDGCELLISGERSLPECCRDGGVRIWEIPFGQFERRLMFDGRQQLTVGKVSLQDGLLAIELRKHS